MKGPTRPAPSVPGFAVNRYSPVTNWNDDPFGADVFEPNPQFAQKKKPPPRPPPPRFNNKQLDIPTKPSHFIRKPTVLSSLLSRKTKTVSKNSVNTNTNLIVDFGSEVDSPGFFSKCDSKTVQTASLIDLSSPPSSPTFTTRSSSDGLSVDSFGSDATTSTNHHNALNGGNASQAESGFEDDFDLFLNNRKPMIKDGTLDDFGGTDPFSPQPQTSNKPPLLKKPTLDSISVPIVPSLKKPTIIRVKPARPKPHDSTAILKSTLGTTLPVTPMNVNTTVPLHKVSNGLGDIFECKPISWENSSLEYSPPMPTIPPPPPPQFTDDDLPIDWSDDALADLDNLVDEDEPYAVALFDYFTDHTDDLCFSTNTKIKLVRRVDEEWLYGRLRSGAEGLFPSNYVQVKVPLPNESAPSTPRIGRATALYDFEPVQPGDLKFLTGDTIFVMHKISDEWYFGECNGAKGQFPVNYVQMC